MKIEFLSILAFDANISLIKALSKTNDVYFITEAKYEKYNHLDQTKLSEFITVGTEVEQIQRFGGYIPLDKTYVVKGARQISIFKKLYESYKINKLVKKINPDIVLLDNYWFTFLFSAIYYRKKTLLLVHDPFLHSGEEFFMDKVLRKFYFKLIKNKILLNESQKQDFIVANNESPDNVFSSFLGVYEYLTCFASQNSNKSDSAFDILFFGRISPYKGIKYLLDAFVEILSSDRYPNMKLTIAGSGDFDFDIEPYKKIPGIYIINKFINPNELSDMITQSSVVVCPYTDATQSGVVMSAFAFKKPIIATNVGGLPEMIDNGVTGLVIEPKNTEAIKDAILKLYNNQEFLKKISENIEKDYFKGDRSWDNSSAKFLQAFNSIRNQK